MAPSAPSFTDPVSRTCIFSHRSPWLRRGSFGGATAPGRRQSRSWALHSACCGRTAASAAPTWSRLRRFADPPGNGSLKPSGTSAPSADGLSRSWPSTAGSVDSSSRLDWGFDASPAGLRWRRRRGTASDAVLGLGLRGPSQRRPPMSPRNAFEPRGSGGIRIFWLSLLRRRPRVVSDTTRGGENIGVGVR